MTITERVDRLPQVLKDMRIWSVVEIGKPADDGISRKKMHYNHKRNGTFASYAKVDDLTTWGFVEDVADAISQWPLTATVETCLPGIARHGNLLILDLDWKGTAIEGIPEFAKRMLMTFPTYAEYSVSGKGMHVIYTVDELDGGNHKLELIDGPTGETFELEIFAGNHFCTLTGNILTHVDDMELPDDVRHHPGVMDDMRKLIEAKVKAEAKEPMPKAELLLPQDEAYVSDDEIVSAIMRSNSTELIRLWNEPGKEHDSGIDQTFFNLLAFWCNGHADVMERIGRMSKRPREKWDRKGDDYVQRTIRKAIAGWDGECYHKWKKVAAQPTPSVIPGVPSSKPEKYSPKFIPIWEKAKKMADAKWLWDGWVPSGSTTLLCGPSRIGKTFWAQELAYAITGITPAFPDGQVPCELGDVLWVDYESQTKTFMVRMTDAGLTPKEHVIYEVDQHNAPKLTSTGRAGDDTAASIDNFLDASLVSIPNLKMIVIDSLSNGSDGDENSSRFGDSISRINMWAQMTGIAVIFLHHTSKRAYKEKEVVFVDVDTIRGSSSIYAQASSVIAVDRPVAGCDICRCRIIKNRLLADSETPVPMGYYLEYSRIVITEEPREPDVRDKHEKCVEWLIGYLATGPKNSRDVIQRGFELGYSDKMVRAAKNSENVIAERVGKIGSAGNTSMWRLPYETAVAKRAERQGLFGEDDE